MAMGDQINDDMDSLFEGMVLFAPQMADNHATNSRSDILPSVRDDNIEALSSISTPSSQPLDENLFSDLTIITPSHIEPSEIQMKTERKLAQPASIIRQSSRKKKRAGLRIGYGRDSQLVDDPEPLPNAMESLSVVEDSLCANTPTIQTDLDVEREEEQDGFLVSSHVSQVKEVEGVEGDLKDRAESHIEQVNKDEQLNLTEESNSASHTIESEELQQEKEKKESSCDSMEGKYEHIKAQISERLRQAQEKSSSLSAAKKDSRRRRRKAAENVELASIKYIEIEKKLEEACEAEDFEMAERLSESLAAAEKEKEHLQNALRDVETECDAIDSKMQEALEHQIATEEECVSLLEHFSKAAVNNADLILENVEVNSSKEMDEWFMSVEVVEAKKLELEIESQLVNQARSTLNDSIEHLVESDVKVKEVLFERKKSLTHELERLLNLVREKEAEIAENDSEIEAVDQRITEIVSGFKDVQSGIDAHFDKLHFVLSQMESEQGALSKKKEEIDNHISKGKNRGKELKKLAMASIDEANMYLKNLGLRKSLLTSALKAREEKLRLANTEEKILADVQMLKQEISVARASLQELSYKKSSMQQEITALKQRMLFIDKRLPELEAEKKVAATSRNFKEAARIASESKSLTSEKENQQTKTEKSMLELGKIEEEITENTQKLQNFEDLISSKEKDAAIARFQRLHLISAACLSERSAALELGDLKEADMLLAEAKNAKSEAKLLQSVHNIRDEELGNLSECFIAMEMVSSLDGKQLEELGAGFNQSSL